MKLTNEVDNISNIGYNLCLSTSCVLRFISNITRRMHVLRFRKVSWSLSSNELVGLNTCDRVLRRSCLSNSELVSLFLFTGKLCVQGWSFLDTKQTMFAFWQINYCKLCVVANLYGMAYGIALASQISNKLQWSVACFVFLDTKWVA
jgi:hypothetical protein